MTEWDDVQSEINSATGGFYKPTSLELNKPEEITVISAVKWYETKYPILGKDYTWRFRLADGRTLDCQNANRRDFLAGLYLGGSKEARPARFKITFVGARPKKTTWTVEYIGPGTTPGGVATPVEPGAEDVVEF